MHTLISLCHKSGIHFAQQISTTELFGLKSHAKQEKPEIWECKQWANKGKTKGPNLVGQSATKAHHGTVKKSINKKKCRGKMKQLR